MTPPLSTPGSVEAAQLRVVPAVQGDEPCAGHPGQNVLVLTELLLLLKLHAFWSGLSRQFFGENVRFDQINQILLTDTRGVSESTLAGSPGVIFYTCLKQKSVLTNLG